MSAESLGESNISRDHYHWLAEPGPVTLAKTFVPPTSISLSSLGWCLSCVCRNICQISAEMQRCLKLNKPRDLLPRGHLSRFFSINNANKLSSQTGALVVGSWVLKRKRVECQDKNLNTRDSVPPVTQKLELGRSLRRGESVMVCKHLYSVA